MSASNTQLTTHQAESASEWDRIKHDIEMWDGIRTALEQVKSTLQHNSDQPDESQFSDAVYHLSYHELGPFEQVQKALRDTSPPSVDGETRSDKAIKLLQELALSSNHSLFTEDDHEECKLAVSFLQQMRKRQAVGRALGMSIQLPRNKARVSAQSRAAELSCKVIQKCLSYLYTASAQDRANSTTQNGCESLYLAGQNEMKAILKPFLGVEDSTGTGFDPEQLIRVYGPSDEDRANMIRLSQLASRSRASS